jgi:hypothetical protein
MQSQHSARCRARQSSHCHFGRCPSEPASVSRTLRARSIISCSSRRSDPASLLRDRRDASKARGHVRARAARSVFGGSRRQILGRLYACEPCGSRRRRASSHGLSCRRQLVEHWRVRAPSSSCCVALGIRTTSHCSSRASDERSSGPTASIIFLPIMSFDAFPKPGGRIAPGSPFCSAGLRTGTTAVRAARTRRCEPQPGCRRAKPRTAESAMLKACSNSSGSCSRPCAPWPARAKPLCSRTCCCVISSRC